MTPERLEHEHAATLLTVFVTGSLEPDRRRALERHLEECADCRRELALERRLAAAVHKTAAPARPRTDLLARTLERIDRHEAESGSGASWWVRLRRSWEGFWQPLALPARTLLAAQLVVILALGVGLVLPRPEPPGDGAGLRTLSGSGGPAVPAGRGRLQVLFQPRATADQITAAVRAVEGAVVAGPSAAGYYTVEVAVGDDPATALAAAAARLEAHGEVVRLAAPETP